jgi:hypothetical protein
VAGGEAVVPQLRAAFNRPEQSRQTLIRLARVCGRIQGESVIALLQSKMDYPDEAVRFQVLKSLSLCDYQAPPEVVESIHRQIKHELADAAWTLAALVDIGEDAGVLKPLTQALNHSELKQNQARLFLLLSFIYDSASILKARDTLSQQNSPPEKRAYALEVIDLLIAGDLKPILLPLFDETISREQCLQQLAAVFPQESVGQQQRLTEIARRSEEWLRPWTVACALAAIARLSLAEAAPAVIEALTAPAPLIREMAVWTLAKLNLTEYWPHIVALADDPNPQVVRAVNYLQKVKPESVTDGVNMTMLSTLEKVFVLKAVDIFAETPEEALAEIASILEEVEVKSGETIFEKGDPGQSMYVIYEGQVRVHDGDQTWNELGSRDIFGDMALLDTETRSASVTALEDTHLLRLDQAPFYELMADQNEVSWGIIRVLVQRIRDLGQMLANAQTQPEDKKKKTGKSRDALLDGIMSKL